MNTLAIDTSTNRGSVALLCQGGFRLEETFLAERSHSATLFAVLERALAMLREEPRPRLDLLAVGLGPGSFAGVRIAVAAAIGMELALGARLVGLPSVAALETDAPAYFAIGDARRETFYFTAVQEGVCSEGPLLLTEEALRERLRREPHLPVFSCETLPAFASMVALPSARRLAALAAADRGIVAHGALEPIYLREPHITQPKPRLPLPGSVAPVAPTAPPAVARGDVAAP